MYKYIHVFCFLQRFPVAFTDQPHNMAQARMRPCLKNEKAFDMDIHNS